MKQEKIAPAAPIFNILNVIRLREHLARLSRPAEKLVVSWGPRSNPNREAVGFNMYTFQPREMTDHSGRGSRTSCCTAGHAVILSGEMRSITTPVLSKATKWLGLKQKEALVLFYPPYTLTSAIEALDYMILYGKVQMRTSHDRWRRLDPTESFDSRQLGAGEGHAAHAEGG